jgi:HEPN domain-containing protein
MQRNRAGDWLKQAKSDLLYAQAAFRDGFHAQACDELARSARLLDQYYITARYPDALAEGTPHEVFTEDQARTAIGYAGTFISKAEEFVA